MERRRLASLPGLSPSARAVLLVIHSAGNKCFKRQTTIADQLHLSRSTVNRAIAWLKGRGIIDGVRRGQNETSVWWVDWQGVDKYVQPQLFGSPTEADKAQKSTPSDVAKCFIRMSQNASSGCRKMRHQTLHPHSNKGVNTLSLAGERELHHEVGEVGEHRAGLIVASFYDRLDSPLPPASVRERDLDVVLRHVARHGEAIVAQAVVELPAYLRSNDQDREFLFAAEAQLRRVLRRVKARAGSAPSQRPHAAADETSTSSDGSDDAEMAAWSRLDEGERERWRTEARRAWKALQGLKSGNRMLEQMAAKTRAESKSAIRSE